MKGNPNKIVRFQKANGEVVDAVESWAAGEVSLGRGRIVDGDVRDVRAVAREDGVLKEKTNIKEVPQEDETMIKIILIETGETKEVTNNEAHGLIESGKAVKWESKSNEKRVLSRIGKNTNAGYKVK